MRAQIREVFEGKFCTILMACVTIFALFGDEGRMGLTDKATDLYFDISLTISLVLFLLEILVNSCVVDDFKYSFFFWLDIIATLSIMPDISFFLDLLQEAVGVKRSKFEADVIPGNPADLGNGKGVISKIVKSLRLIRLIRIIKLYKYVAKSSNEAEELRLREQ